MYFLFKNVFFLCLLVYPAMLAAQTDAKQTSTSENDAPVFTPPELVEYIQADYPFEALENNLEATVTAELEIDENGLVVGVTITKPAGHGFDEAAEAAMFQFVFSPATRDAVPIGAKVLYRYKFFLKVEEPSPEEIPPPQAELAGVITDMNEKPIPDASVVVIALDVQEFATGEKTNAVDSTIETKKTLSHDIEPTSTDESGKFPTIVVLPGRYQVDIVAPGYKLFSVVEELADGEKRDVIYRLEVEETLYETVIRGRRPPREVTRREISRREITRIPGTGGDALRAVQNMPGMARAPMMSGALIVRGSSPDDSSYFFDQMPIPMLYHFGGLTSVINSDLLERIDFYPGNYSVRYGGATGGIVDVFPRAPHTDRFHAYIDADLWDISVLAETPLGKNWSIAVSARRSWIDAILGAVAPEDMGVEFTVAPRYYDYQLVADYHPHKKDNLRLFIFGSDDKMVFLFGDTVSDDPNFSGGIDFSILFHQGQIRWDHHFSKAISNSVNIGSGFQRSNTSFGNLFQYEVDSVPVNLRDEFVYDAGGILALHTGIDAELYWAKWKIRAPNVQYGEGEEYTPSGANREMAESVSDSTFIRPAWYGELEIRPIERLRLINGLRISYYNWVSEVAIDPRFVARFQLFKGTTLKGGIGLFHQPPAEDKTQRPFGNPDLDLINAVHYSLGVEQQIFENIEFGVEGFYKDLSNLVVSSENIIEGDNGETTPEMYNNDGIGQVYGLEFMLKHNATDRFFGWITYTLMSSKRIDHPGEKSRLFDYDQTHILTVVASLVLGRGWEAGIRFRLVSGNPETPIVDSIYDSDSDIYLPIYGETNSDRLPLFHQLDLRIDKKWTGKYLKYSIYLDITNLYNQENPEGFQYNYDFTQKKYFNGLPVIPSFGMKLEY
jgi:TonB family protein